MDRATDFIKQLGAIPDLDALRALTSEGLVRRAIADLETDRPVFEKGSTDVLTLRIAKSTVQIPLADPLRASCDCPSPGICRHVLSCLIDLRARKYSGDRSEPQTVEESARDEITKLSAAGIARFFGEATVKHAHELLKKQEVRVEIEPQPIVHFAGGIQFYYFAGLGLAGCRIVGKSKDEKKLKAAGVLALRSHFGIIGEDTSSEPKGSRTPGCLPQISEALVEMLKIGLSRVPRVFAHRLSMLSITAQIENLHSLSLLLRALAHELTLSADRHAAADESKLFSLCARTYAMVQSLQRAIEKGQEISPRFKTDYETVSSLRLTGLGAYPWHTQSGFVGITALFKGDDDQTYTWSDARPQGVDSGFDPIQVYKHHSPWRGAKAIRELVNCTFVLENAGVNPVGRISSQESASVSEIFDTKSNLIGHIDFRDMINAIHQPGILDPEMDATVLLKPHKWGRREFDEITQTLKWEIQDTRGERLWLTIAYSELTERAIANLELLSSTHKLDTIVGLLKPGTRNVLPVSLIAGSGVIDLHFAQIDTGKLQGNLLEKFKAAVLSVRSPPPAMESQSEQVLTKLSHTLERMAESGSASRVQDQELAPQLDALGFTFLASQLSSLKRNPTPAALLRLRFLTECVERARGYSRIRKS